MAFRFSVTLNVIWSSKIRGKIRKISYAFDLFSDELYSVKYPYEHTVAIAFIIITNGVLNVFLPLCEFTTKSYNVKKKQNENENENIKCSPQK